jgi:hypothetical protein
MVQMMISDGKQPAAKAKLLPDFANSMQACLALQIK